MFAALIAYNKEITSVYFSRMSMYCKVVAAYILYDLN